MRRLNQAMLSTVVLLTAACGQQGSVTRASMCSKSASILFDNKQAEVRSEWDPPGGYIVFDELQVDGKITTKKCSFYLDLFDSTDFTSARVWTATHCFSAHRLTGFRLMVSSSDGYIELPATLEAMEKAQSIMQNTPALPDAFRKKLLTAFVSPEESGPANPLFASGKYICGLTLGISGAQLAEYSNPAKSLADMTFPDKETHSKVCATVRDVSTFEVKFKGGLSVEVKDYLAFLRKSEVERRAAYALKNTDESNTWLKFLNLELQSMSYAQWLTSQAVFLLTDEHGGSTWRESGSQKFPEDFSDNPNSFYLKMAACENGNTAGVCAQYATLWPQLKKMLVDPEQVKSHLQKFYGERKCEIYGTKDTSPISWETGLVLSGAKTPDLGDVCRKTQAILAEIEAHKADTGISKYSFLRRMPHYSAALQGNAESAWVWVGPMFYDLKNSQFVFQSNTKIVPFGTAVDFNAGSGEQGDNRFKSVIARSIWPDFPPTGVSASTKSKSWNGGALLVSEKSNPNIALLAGDSGAIFSLNGYPIAAVNSVNGVPSSGGAVLHPLPKSSLPSGNDNVGTGGAVLHPLPKPAMVSRSTSSDKNESSSSSLPTGKDGATTMNDKSEAEKAAAKAKKDSAGVDCSG